MIVKLTLVSIVVAVVAPRLGNVLQFHICGVRQAEFTASIPHLRLKKVRTYNRDVPGMQSQVALQAQALQLGITGDGKCLNRWLVCKSNLGDNYANALLRIPL